MDTNLPSGYVIVYGDTNTYSQSVILPRTTTTTITNLLPNTTYRFAAYAYAGQLQSDLTPPVTYTTPLERPTSPTGFATRN